MKTLHSLFIFEVNIMSDNGYIGITEAVEITGKHITTIYKAIRRGHLTAIEAIENSKTVKKVLKTDVVKLYGVKSLDNLKTAIDNSKDGYRPAIDDYRKAIEEVLEAKQAQLMKPIEEQALYRLGRIEQENQFLKAKVETLLQELEQYKALPCPAEMEEKEQQIRDLQQEKEALEGKINTLTAPIESVNQILMENAHNLSVLQKCKSELMEKLKQKEQEKEEALKELEARLKAEAEEAQKLIVDAWKKELEQARKPWYRRIFS